MSFLSIENLIEAFLYFLLCIILVFVTKNDKNKCQKQYHQKPDLMLLRQRETTSCLRHFHQPSSSRGLLLQYSKQVVLLSSFAWLSYFTFICVHKKDLKWIISQEKTAWFKCPFLFMQISMNPSDAQMSYCQQHKKFS